MEHGRAGVSSVPAQCTVEELAALIRDGDSIVGGGLPLWRKPLALLAAVARSGVSGLTYSAFLASLDAELLVASGCVAELEYGYVGRDILGSSRVLARRNDVVRRTRTEFEYWAALRARAEGVPAWPDAFGDPVTAASYGVCVLHASIADAGGNIFARPLDLMEEDDRLLALASGLVLVTVERQQSRAPEDAVLLLPAELVTAFAVAPGGAAPLGMAGMYPPVLDELVGGAAVAWTRRR
jgi:acyl CoA:acetate/3-ketoacid CoA transferase alpha subunit